MTLDGEGLQNLRAVIRKSSDVVASLLDLRDPAVHVDQLRLTIRAPIRRTEEHEDQAILAHEVGERTRLAVLIESRPDIRRLGCDRRPEIFRMSGNSRNPGDEKHSSQDTGHPTNGLSCATHQFSSYRRVDRFGLYS